MYRCTACQKTVPANTPQRLRVTTRPAVYPLRMQAHPIKRAPRQKWPDDPGGQGHEIASAAPVCPACAAANPRA